METKIKITNEPVLLLDGNRGIYIPKIFAEEIINGVYRVKNREDLTVLLNDLDSPNNEYYWESWEDLLNNCILLDSKGNEFTLYQNDDLWAIPEGYDMENFFE